LTTGVRYTFTICNVSGSFQSCASIVSKTPGTVPPPAPWPGGISKVRAVLIGSKHARVTWAVPSFNATQLEIDRQIVLLTSSGSKAGKFVMLKTSLPANTKVYDDYSIVPGVINVYRVCLMNKSSYECSSSNGLVGH
jgi:hypothetical protein